MIWRFAAVAGVWLFGVAGAAAQELPRIAEPAQAHQRYSAVGYASWYGSEVHGHATADGETFDTRSLSAAHRTMPLPCYARVTNLGNGRSIVVRVNDRGPFIRGRILDVSARVAKLLEIGGVAKVRIDYVGKAAPAGTDENALLASLRTGGAPVASTSLVAGAAPEEGLSVVARAFEPARTSELASPLLRRSPDESEIFAAHLIDSAKSNETRSPFGALIMPASWAQPTQTASAAP